MPEPFEVTTARRIDRLERALRNLSTIETGYTTGDVIGTVLMFEILRGFWPFSSLDENGKAIDLSGQGRTLTNSGGPGQGVVSLIPYTSLNGSSQYFYRASETGLAITGALTLGGWFYPTSISGVHAAIAKDDVNVQRAYSLLTNSAQLDFTVFGGGTNKQVISTVAVAQNTWSFWAGRFTPSTEVAIFHNDTKTVNTTAIIASLNAATAEFDIGRDSYGAGPRYFAGNAALCFLCAAALSDSVLSRFYNISRGFFGV